MTQAKLVHKNFCLPEHRPALPVVWSVGGSDSSGGAGIQADLLTCHDFGVHCATVIATLTAQNPQHLAQIEPCSDEMLAEQLVVLARQQPARVIKIGMLASPMQVELLAEAIEGYKAYWIEPPLIIYDPVLKLGSGTVPSDTGLAEALPRLLAHVDLLIPGAHVLEQLSGVVIDGSHAIKRACRQLMALGIKSVLVKGGHFQFALDYALDYYCDGSREILLSGLRIATHHHHGSGCSLTSALAAALALDYSIEDALILAKAYLTQGLRMARPTGFGSGSVAHVGWPVERDEFPRVESSYTPLGQLFDMQGGVPEGLNFASCETLQLGLYPVVADLRWVELLLKAGVKSLLLRIKDMKGDRFESTIEQAVALGRRYQARLFINNHWRLALKYQAYGVHLGQEDLEQADLVAIAEAGLRLGVSAGGYYELMRTHQLAPSYIALDGVFLTLAKPSPPNDQALVRLQRYVALMSDYPLVALGNVDRLKVNSVSNTSIGGIAVADAMNEVEELLHVVRQFNERMENK